MLSVQGQSVHGLRGEVERAWNRGYRRWRESRRSQGLSSRYPGRRAAQSAASSGRGRIEQGGDSRTIARTWTAYVGPRRVAVFVVAISIWHRDHARRPAQGRAGRGPNARAGISRCTRPLSWRCGAPRSRYYRTAATVRTDAARDYRSGIQKDWLPLRRRRFERLPLRLPQRRPRPQIRLTLLFLSDRGGDGFRNLPVGLGGNFQIERRCFHDLNCASDLFDQVGVIGRDDVLA